MIIKKSEVYRLIHKYGMRVSPDYLYKLDEIVKKIIEDSIIRAQMNKRLTLQERDL